MRVNEMLPVVKQLEIKMPDGSNTGVVLTVVGQDSVQFRSMARKLASSMTTRKDRPSIDELEQQNAELIATCIVGWTGLEDEEGNPLPYSHEEALKLMTNPGLHFMRDQVEEFAKERTNFFRGSAEGANRGSKTSGKAKHA